MCVCFFLWLIAHSSFLIHTSEMKTRNIQCRCKTLKTIVPHLLSQATWNGSELRCTHEHMDAVCI